MGMSDDARSEKRWVDRVDRLGRIAFWPAGLAASIGAIFCGTVTVLAAFDRSLSGVVVFGLGAAFWVVVARYLFSRRRRLSDWA